MRFRPFFSKTKPGNGDFTQMFAPEPSKRGKYNHSFIFLHVLPEFGLVVINVPLTHTSRFHPHLSFALAEAAQKVWLITQIGFTLYK